MYPLHFSNQTVSDWNIASTYGLNLPYTAKLFRFHFAKDYSNESVLSAKLSFLVHRRAIEDLCPYEYFHRLSPQEFAFIISSLVTTCSSFFLNPEHVYFGIRWQSFLFSSDLQYFKSHMNNSHWYRLTQPRYDLDITYPAKEWLTWFFSFGVQNACLPQIFHKVICREVTYVIHVGAPKNRSVIWSFPH